MGSYWREIKKGYLKIVSNVDRPRATRESGSMAEVPSKKFTSCSIQSQYTASEQTFGTQKDEESVCC
jgi:hypothetical protein